jgi:hypothetical protein
VAGRDDDPRHVHAVRHVRVARRGQQLGDEQVESTGRESDWKSDF